MVIHLIKGVVSMIRKRLLSITLSLALVFGSAAALPEGVISESASIMASAEGDYLIPQLETNTSGAKSSNVSNNNYSTYGSTVNSYLYEDSDNYLWRVEYIESKIVIEMYSQGAKKLLKTYTVKPELPLYGGVFFGEDYNYVVSGQRNPDYDDNIEVLRVTKYTKQWEKVNHASVYGANTLEPFHAGSCRLAEASGKLYVDTCHLMYKSGDGLNHQANMCYVVDESEMSVIQSQYTVWNIGIGYVSHSFNQFITTDGENIYRIDHGDAYPRGIPVIVNSVSSRITNVDYTVPVTFEGAIGQNSTGASIGGLEVSSDTILFPYNQEPDSSSSFRNVLINVTSKDLGSSYQKNLTNYDGSSNVTCSTPQIVKVNNDMYVVLWEETDKTTSKNTVRLVSVDRYGNKTSNIGAIDANLSDCQPILCSDGCIRWYVTSGSSPLVYAIQPYDINSLHIHKANWKVTKKATCTTDGKKTGKCSVCGKTVTQIIKATGHEWEMWPEVSWDGGDKATAIFRCCNNSSHTISAKATIESTRVITPATCSNTGIKSASIKVSFNGYTYTFGKTASIPKIAHKFSAWTTTKKATCTANGTRTRKCSVCGKTETKSIAKLSHSYKATVVKPTCSAKGYTLHKCTKCGYSYKDKYTNTVAHKFSAWKTTSFNVDKGTSTQKRTCSVCKKSETRTVKNAIVRYAGANRYDTAAKISNGVSKFSYEGTEAVILVNGTDFHDALIAVPLAKKFRIPLLLCSKDSVPAATLNEIKRLKAKLIHVVNTNGAISSKAIKQLKGYHINQITGKTCYETSAKIAKILETANREGLDGPSENMFFTTSKSFADSLSASAPAGAAGAPIMYVDPTKKTLDSHILAYIKSTKGKIKNAYIIGGTTAIPKAIENSIKKALPKSKVTRIGGATRYETCVMINKYFASLLNSKTVCIAKGLDFPDALAGGVFAALNRSPILLADSTLRDAQKSFLKAKKPNKLYIFGGTVAVPDKLAKEVAKMSV